VFYSPRQGFEAVRECNLLRMSVDVELSSERAGLVGARSSRAYAFLGVAEM
jgi:hypothetical protein